MRILLSILSLGVFSTWVANAGCGSDANTSCVTYGNYSDITGPNAVCKRVTNNHASIRSLMVPTKTTAEWTQFYGAPPAGVTVAACPASCSGASVGGYCWYLAAANTSCDAFCGTHGGCNSTGTVNYAGSGGTLANCNSVLAALGVVSETTQEIGFSWGIGCFSLGGSRYRDTGMAPPTTCGASNMTWGRACACAN